MGVRELRDQVVCLAEEAAGRQAGTCGRGGLSQAAAGGAGDGTGVAGDSGARALTGKSASPPPQTQPPRPDAPLAPLRPGKPGSNFLPA